MNNEVDNDDDNASYISKSGTKRKGKKGKKKQAVVSDAALIAAQAELIGEKSVDNGDTATSNNGQQNDDLHQGNNNKLNNDNDDDGSVVSFMSASGTKRKKKKKKKKHIDSSTSAEAIATAAAEIGNDDDQSIVSYMSSSGVKRKKKKGNKGIKSGLEDFLNQGPPPPTTTSMLSTSESNNIDLKNLYSIDSNIKMGKPRGAATVGARTVSGGGGDGEIYINKDGKKVRRVRKNKSKSTDDLPETSLSGMLTAHHANAKSTGPATVAGGGVSTIESTSEVYINKDGKKVRRVKKTVTRVKTKEERADNNSELANMLESGKPSAKTTAAATVSGPITSRPANNAELGEIYINKDGKKVRRVKRTVSKSTIDTEPKTTTDTEQKSSLRKMLDDNNNHSKVAGSATVANAVETEIYIRADGKKVRRVKRSSSGTVGSSAASLSGLSSLQDGSTIVGSMSVGGDVISEIYINKDGKKVRRIRKAPPAAIVTSNKITDVSDISTIASASKSVLSGDDLASTKPSASSNLLDGLLKVEGKTKKIVGAATVATPTKTTVESEIYINKDGKKVRRIRKTNAGAAASITGDLNKLLTSTSKPGASGGATVGGDRPTLTASSDEGEIYIRADGKKVRRVRKSSAAASVSGEPTASNTSLKGFLDNDELLKPRLVNSATVAGDKLSTKLDGGEIVIRADGKKVIRRVKKKEQENEQETEVYRRADGKLVRRIKKDTKATAAPDVPTVELSPEEEKIAVEYRKLKKMGLPDDAVRHKMTVSNVHPKIIAAVMGDKWTDPVIVLETSKPTPVESDFLGSSHHLNTSIQLTGGEEALAIQFRKLKSLGLPDDAVRHKMIAAKVDPKVIAAVFDEAWPSQPSIVNHSEVLPKQVVTVDNEETKNTANEDIGDTTIVPTIADLTPDQQEAVNEFRKMKRFGLSDDALRRRMELSEVDPKIIAIVLNASPSTAPTISSSIATNVDTSGNEITILMPVPKQALDAGEMKDSPIILQAPPTNSLTEDKSEIMKNFTNQLTEEEESIASQFKKLQKMGLSDEVVRHKMTVAGVSAKVIAYVFDEEWNMQGTQKESMEPKIQLTDDEETVAAEFRKMQRMGLPNEVVKHKMTALEVPPRIIAAVLEETFDFDESVTKTAPPQVLPSTESTSQLDDDEEKIAAEYRKMQKLGLPNEVVRHKMIAMEVHPKIVASVLGEVWSDSAPAIATQQATQPPTITIQLSDEEEHIAAEFRKMQKMGLPNDVVRHKMTSIDVHSKIMAAVLGEEWTEPVTTNVQIPPATEEKDLSSSAIQLSDDEEAVALQFRKMQKMGLPDDVVRHKMISMDVNSKIVAVIMGEPWNEPSAVDQESEVLPTALPNVSAIQLDEDEENIAAQFRRMQKMGLPSDVVRHKMASMDIHPKIVAAVLGEPWTDPDESRQAVDTSAATSQSTAVSIVLNDDEEALAAQFRKMQKMGLPSDVVRHKMASMDVHPKIVAAVLGEPWTDPTESRQTEDSRAATSQSTAVSILLNDDEEALAAQFRKMQKMGLPSDVVRHKMASMDIHPKIVAAVLGEPWTDPEASKEAVDAGTAASQTVATPIVLNVDEEALAAQFRKMQKMGLPSDVVRHKMASMDIHPKIVAAVLGEPWTDSSASNKISSAFPAAVELDETENAIADQFRKMQKAGLPDELVKQKMAAMDVHPTIVAFVLGESWDDPSGTPTPANATVLNASSIPKGSYLVLEDDVKLNSDEKFAVKIAEGTSDGSQQTKFVTLSELATMSGQSQSELEAIVRDKKKRSSSPPRFVIQTTAEEKFEVELPQSTRSNSGAGVPAASGGVQIKAGEEVVDSTLASAARAVSALGDGDLSALIAKLQTGDMAELLSRLREAEKRQKKLEKQLQQAGVAIAEDIDYAEAKNKVEQIAKRMNEIGGSDVVAADKNEQNRLREEYFKLEQEMERYNTALMMSEEYQQEQDRMARKWEDDNEADNLEALKRIRRHMPVMIRHMSEADLANKPSPNGKYLPKSIAKKFKRTNVLQCLRLNPMDLERMHPCTLENMRVTGLTLTERRAVYLHLRTLGPKWEKNKAEKMTERKWTWYQMMKNNFKENLDPFLRHCAQYGPPSNHPYATRENPNVGCPLLGKQCPVRADKEFDYSDDYGYPDGDEYEVSEVKKSDADDPGAKAQAEAAEFARAKKANERADILKKHYKGKLLHVSKANGSCESMDEAMDRMENHTIKWIEFAIGKGKDELEADKKKEISNFTEALNELKLSSVELANRSGMQTSGKKKAGGDAPDIRSSVEASLAEETFECTREMFKFIKDRMKEIQMVDTRVEKTIEVLDGTWLELHDKNTALLGTVGMKRSTRSRKLKKNSDLRKEVEDKQKPTEPEPVAEAEGPPRPPMGGGGRGGLMDAISGRGRGRGGEGGGRGGLLDAISGGGRGRGRGGGGGRGGLLDSIQGRGRGGGGGGRGGLLDAIQGRGAGGGGRGGLLDAIKTKGGDGGGGGVGGGRGDLLSAIAGRGRGKGSGDGGGGRGGLLAAIAARGGGE